jgi:hypothetical protein
MTHKPPEFLLSLRAEGAGPPGIIRLRRALKCLLRSCGLRCVRVEILDGPEVAEGGEVPPETNVDAGSMVSD